MKKIRLELDALEVDSFTTAGQEGREQGTVHGEEPFRKEAGPGEEQRGDAARPPLIAPKRLYGRGRGAARRGACPDGRTGFEHRLQVRLGELRLTCTNSSRDRALQRARHPSAPNGRQEQQACDHRPVARRRFHRPRI
ncbi:MAG TPA: hypothetical protein VHG93_05565 [Longimicrobium sp.]|nr:hypothetical protein [Longimicrobium sp.]